MGDTVNNIANGVTSTKDTFSSWDKCMQKTYCKWPVIIVIVVGSLIAISIIFCIARCLCCGAECACCCFRCCAGCCGSGRGGGNGRHKRMNSAPTQNAYNAPYRSQPVPSYAPAPAHSPYIPSRSTYDERPQFARFESAPKPVNEDALPAMPSWSDAKSTRVEDTSPVDDVEMKPLNPSGSNMAAAAPVATPLGRSPVQSPHGEVDAYGFPPQIDRSNSYSATGGYHTGPYTSNNSFRGQAPQSHQRYGGGTFESSTQSHYPSHNDGYQESGVYHSQETYEAAHSQQSRISYPDNHNTGYSSRVHANYGSSPHHEQSATPYPEDNQYGSHQSQQYTGWRPQPVQQSGWQSRQPANGTWKEM